MSHLNLFNGDATPSEPEPEGPKGEFIWPLNDMGNAERFAQLLKGKAFFVFETGRWIVWRKKRWTSKGQAVMAKQKRVIAKLYKEARSGKKLFTIYGEPVDPADVLTWAKKSSSRGKLKAMLELAKDLPGMSISQEQLDATPYLLGVANGVLDLRTGALRENRPEDLITKYSPIRYNPEAPCPAFRKFISEVADGRDDLVAFLQEVVGYILSGLTKEQAFFLLFGKGANGKSTFVELLAQLLGDYAVGMPGHSFVMSESRAIRNDLARLVSMRLASSVEINTARKLDEALVKRITGNDLITARFLGKEFFDFRPVAKFVFSLNTLPIVTGADEGIFRRLVVVPFDADFSDRLDRDLPEKLAQELEGILVWALEGFQRWHQRGHLVKPACVLEAGKQYRENMDTVQAFIDDECILEATASEGLGALYKAYSEWCIGNCITPKGKMLFTTLMHQKGFKKRKSGGWIWEGIRLNRTLRKQGAANIDSLFNSGTLASQHPDEATTGSTEKAA